MSYVKGESDLPEAPEKWRCSECESVFEVPLWADHPFMEGHRIAGCPECREADTLNGACQWGVCEEVATCGAPNVGGYRYMRLCGLHYRAATPPEAKP